tara:strand:- start:197 stop:2284 length:2088 start_codon:yes stop_codon:yes gene_type:complete
MSDNADFIIEIGTEELPPKALKKLMVAFGENINASINSSLIKHGDIKTFASPRRLAVLVENLAYKQSDKKIEHKGPPINISFDNNGQPTKAAEAFAKKYNTSIDSLERKKTCSGEWLSINTIFEGKKTTEVLPELIEKALDELPIPRRMKWGESKIEFVRPIHWILMLHGDETIKTSIFNIKSNDLTWGHRFQSSGPLKIRSVNTYLVELEKNGYVIADFKRRRDLVRIGVEEAAQSIGGFIKDGEILYDEVASLVEWPTPLIGSFEENFLQLPQEVIISTLTEHQRYFPVTDKNNKLLAKFITVANIESKNPEVVIDGNERVIRPRLADAVFFWNNDKQRKLSSRKKDLGKVVYQKELGSLLDKSQRISEIAKHLSTQLNLDFENVSRAALLAKCDLLTGMVGEFPTLQGIMGYHYATADGEKEEVTLAIRDHYKPRFAGDQIPQTLDGMLLAISDKLDTLSGLFYCGKKPSGNRDPFGLRRSALGLIRILIEGSLDVNLKNLIDVSLQVQPKNKKRNEQVTQEIYEFIVERLKGYLLSQESSLKSETFDAVLFKQPSSIFDFCKRVEAVHAFTKFEKTESLISANKRIANILKKNNFIDNIGIDENLLDSKVELTLFKTLNETKDKIEPMLKNQNYTKILNELTKLNKPIDQFFDEVMVMANEKDIRNNRLALLNELRYQFLNVADISRLSII